MMEDEEIWVDSEAFINDSDPGMTFPDRYLADVNWRAGPH